MQINVSNSNESNLRYTHTIHLSDCMNKTKKIAILYKEISVI